VIGVLHLIKTLNLGGAESNLYNLVRYHDRQKFKLHVAYSMGGPFESLIEKEGVRLYRFEKKRHSVKSLMSPVIVMKLAFYMLRHRIKIVHTHNFAAHVWGCLAAKLVGAKIIEHVHDPRYDSPELQASRPLPKTSQFDQVGVFARMSDAIIVLTHDNRDHILRSGFAPAEKIHLLYNGIPLEHPAPAPPPKDIEPFLKDGRRIIFAAMRLSAEKNAPFIVEIAERTGCEEALFLIAGDGPERARIEQAIAQKSLGNCVKLLGYRSDVNALMDSSDIVILPTLRELHSIVMLEAMSRGVPVAVSQGAGCNDYFLKHGENGFVLDPFDANVWAEALQKLLREPGLAKRVGEAGRKLVERECDIKVTSKNIEAIYLELAGRK
jgi:L-malate glycosyltransferase